jgi:probable HAF family extracellular repeat protein
MHVLRACLAAAAVVLLVSPLVAQSSFIAIPGLGGGFSTLWAVNELGQAVGWSETTGYDSEHAVLWTDGQLIDLGILPEFEFTASRAYGVNDLGQVVGISFEVSTFRTGATLWENGRATPFPAGYTECRPVGINNDGAILATSCNAGAVILHDGQATPLGTLPGYPQNEPAAINDAGVVAGTLSDGRGRSVPYRWTRGTLTPLELPPGATSGRATGINARGTIVGTVRTPGSEPAMWEDRTAAPLAGTWGRFSGQASGINARGEVLANGSDLVTGQGHAFVCLRGTCRLIDPRGVALDINNSGLAVGRRYFEDIQEQHSVLWPKSLTRVPVRLPDRTIP